MKKVQKINCFLIAAAVLALSAAPVMAMVDVTQTDVGKTGGKFSDFVQKQKDNYQNAQERVSGSQFGTTVGNGIKSAKAGIAWAQEAMGKAAEYKDKVMNDPKVQAALLSKQAVSIGMEVKSLEEDRQGQIAAIDTDVEVEKATLEEKKKLAEENLATAMAVYNDELAAAQSDEEKDRIKKEMEEYQQNSSLEQKEFDESLKKIKKDAEKKKKSVLEDFAEQIYERTEQAKELEQQIEELLSKDKEEKGQVEQDPAELIEQKMEDLSYKEGQEITLQDRKDKEKKREKRIVSTAVKTFNTSATNSSTTDEQKDQQKILAGTSKLQLGQSDSAQTGVESTLNQIDALYNYLLIELQNIEFETAWILSKSTIAVGEVQANTDICNYNGKNSTGFLDTVKNMQNTATGIASAAQSSVTAATSTVSTVTSTATSAASTATGMVGDAKNTASGLSGMM